MAEITDKQTDNKPDNKGKQAPDKLQNAIEIPGYIILSKIGERASSTVWKAKQESLKRIVAIRILKPEFSADEAKVEAFVKEAKVVANLKNPNIIQIYDFGRHNDLFYIVLEYVDGVPLEKILESQKPMGQSKALTIAAAVADALNEAWNKGKIVHRNINPANIIIEKDGGIKISNLGLAGIIQSSKDLTAAGVASDPWYASPEQFSHNEDIDFRTDMYSLGAVLYHMLTGRKPFADKSEDEIASAHKFAQLPYPCDVRSSITQGCAQLLMRLMMKEPRYRFKDWEIVYKDLLKLSEGKIVMTKMPTGTVSTVAMAGAMAVPRGPAAIPARRAVRGTPGTKGKVMVQRKSTVVPPAAPASPEELKKRQKELKKKYAPAKAPAWLKIPLESVMLIWFLWLGYQLLWLPMKPADVKETPSAVPTSVVEKTDAGPEPQRPEPPRAVIEPTKQRHNATDDNALDQSRKKPRHEKTRHDRKNDNNSRETLSKEPDTKPDNSISQADLAATKRKLVQTLMLKDVDAARLVLEKAFPNSANPEVEELRRFLAAAPLKEKAVLRALERSIGIKKTIVINGHRRTIAVTHVKDNTVSADLYINRGGSQITRPVTFRISELEPAEQIKLLGDNDKPNIALTKFLLYMSSLDYMNALKIADKCGPLADACKAEANAKIKMLIE